MIVDERIYTLKIGKIKVYLELYERMGLAVQTKILGHMVGYFHTEVGPLNQIVHLWAYDSFEERSRRRAILAADPEWMAYVKEMRPLLEKQENKILVPAPFSPLGEMA
ncbi:MAG: NIPSNAP family protein [Sneathiella sp.]|nr:NIPSNAP family protein [Sneathiella sp.]